MVELGTGKDTITDFAAGSTGQDVVRLSGFTYTSFGQVQAGMTQSGADTVLALSNGSSVTFLGRTVSQFAADDFGFAASTAPTYTISGAPSVSEGGSLVFTVNRTSDNGAQTLSYSLGGTATSGTDYTTPSGSVSFAAGELSKQLTVATLTDTLVEGNESVVVTLTGVTGADSVLSSSSKAATGTLVDITPTSVSQPPVSGTPVTWTSGTSANDTMTGDDRNNSLNGAGGQDTTSGGKGDDTYVVDQQGDRVVELTGEGVDTVGSWAPTYTLSAHVENLILRGTNQTGTGNELANRITGGGGADTLSGKAGNDWLAGRGGADTFVFERGTGHDVVTDFVTDGASHDIAKLTGFGYTSFSQVQAALTQAGADTLLTLSDGSQVTFLNHTVGQFTAGDFVL